MFSSVWAYAKLVSEEATAFFSKQTINGDPRPSFFPLDRRLYGRDDVVAEVVEKIKNGVNAVSIFGPPGIGKSAVGAALLYHQYSKEHFENRRHWACFRDVTTIDLFFSVLYSALCMNADTSRNNSLPIPTQTSEDHVLTIILSPQTPNLPRLLILDDIDAVLESHRNVVEPILHQLVAIPNLTVTITVQGTISLQAAYHRKLLPLSPRDAKFLFLDVYPRPDPMLDDLVQQLDFHPLAIVVVAHICQSHRIRPSAVLHRWQAHGLFRLPTESEEPGEVPLLLSVQNSINRLSPESDATKLFRIICALPAGVMLNDLGRVAPTIQNIDETARLLDNLSLASMDEGDHLTVLAPIRSQVTYHQLDQQSKRDLFFHHFEVAKEGLRNIRDAGYVAGINKLLKRQQNVESILFSALEDGDVPAIEATLHYSSPRCTMRPRLDLVKKAIEAAKRNEFSLPQDQALHDGSVALTAQCILRYGEMNIEAGQFGQWFDEAIERFEKLGDEVAIAHCNFSRAHGIWINNGNQGIKDLEQVRDTFAKLGNVAGESKCQSKLANYYMAGDRLEDARETCQSLLSKSTDPYHKASCQRILARIYLQENRLEDARYLLVTAIDTFKKFADRYGSAECQVVLAHVYRRLGRIEDARASLRQAILEYDFLGRNLNAAFTRWELGRIAESDEAIRVFEDAIPAFWKSEFVFAGAECRLELGLRCMGIWRLDDALLHLQIARQQLQANRTFKLAARCLAFIIFNQVLMGDEENASLALEAGRYELHAHFLQGRLPGSEPPNLTLREFTNIIQHAHVIGHSTSDRD